MQSKISKYDKNDRFIHMYLPKRMYSRYCILARGLVSKMLPLRLTIVTTLSTNIETKRIIIYPSTISFNSTEHRMVSSKSTRMKITARAPNLSTKGNILSIN